MNALDTMKKVVAALSTQMCGEGELAGELEDAMEDVFELLDTQQETLKMLEAAHRQLGMFTGDNKRIKRAKFAIEHVGGKT